MATNVRLDEDLNGINVDQTICMYRGIIGSLLYLTANRPYISFSVGLSCYGCYSINRSNLCLTEYASKSVQKGEI